jgi:hypothetical protein
MHVMATNHVLVDRLFYVSVYFSGIETLDTNLN